MFKDVKKILIVKLCCFGDMVFITPAICALRKKFPCAEITLLYSDWVKDLIPYLPYIDNSINFENPFEKNKIKLFASGFKILRKLRKEKFDLAFLGHTDNRFGLLIKLAGIKYRLGFSETKHLNYTAKFNYNLKESKRYLAVLENNNIADCDDNLVLKPLINKNELKKENGFNENDLVVGVFPFGGINPGTDMNIKRWSLHKYIELAQRVKNKFANAKIIFFEGKLPEESIKKDIKTEFDKDIKISKIDIDLIFMCDVFISNDTGPLHIASGFGVNTIGIFGPSDPNLVAPESTSTVIHKNIWLNIACSPCYTPETARDKNNPKYWRDDKFICYMTDNACMRDISVDTVFNEFTDLHNKILEMSP
jgi:ADP-heptose:LPS heptosyltransferase